jgi:hypothetical protein
MHLCSTLWVPSNAILPIDSLQPCLCFLHEPSLRRLQKLNVLAFIQVYHCSILSFTAPSTYSEDWNPLRSLWTIVALKF